MKRIVTSALFALGLAAWGTAPGALAKSDRAEPVAADAQTETLSTIPSTAASANRWLKQDIYDTAGNKIGEVEDLIVADNHSIEAAIVSVGGFIGIKEKHVAVPINAIRPTESNGRWRLIMNATKEVLKSAPGFKYDRSQEIWTAG
jgi:sporulation protein YlmC with PRC-barrel domain